MEGEAHGLLLGALPNGVPGDLGAKDERCGAARRDRAAQRGAEELGGHLAVRGQHSLSFGHERLICQRLTFPLRSRSACPMTCFV